MSWLRRHSEPLTTLLLLAISAGLLVANTRGPRRIDPLSFVLLDVVSPFARATRALSGRLGAGWSAYVDLIEARQERDWLRLELRRLERDLDRHRSFGAENERLRALLDLREILPGQPVVARITGADASGLFRTATLGKGSADGIIAGMGVIAPDGVVGRVVASSAHAARVLLLEDPSTGIEALVQRSRARGIVEGGSSAGCRLKYVRRREDLQVGDRIVTSGRDGVFPRGLPIGTVTALVEEDRGLFIGAEIAPAADFSHLEEVLVVPSPLSETGSLRVDDTGTRPVAPAVAETAP